MYPMSTLCVYIFQRKCPKHCTFDVCPSLKVKLLYRNRFRAFRQKKKVKKNDLTKTLKFLLRINFMYRLRWCACIWRHVRWQLIRDLTNVPSGEREVIISLFDSGHLRLFFFWKYAIKVSGTNGIVVAGKTCRYLLDGRWITNVVSSVFRWIIR